MEQLFIAVVAAGKGSRMQQSISDFDISQLGDLNKVKDVAKQYYPLGNGLVIESCLNLFLNPQLKVALGLEQITTMVGLNKDDQIFKNLTQASQVITVIGGSKRVDTVVNLINQAAQLAVDLDQAWIMIHDAARPFINQQDLINLWQNRNLGGVLLATPATDTIKEIEVDQQGNHLVQKTLERKQIWLAQTPQLLNLGETLRILKSIDYTKVTDDVSFLEMAGHKPTLIASCMPNLKITTLLDWITASSLIKLCKQ